MALSTLTQIRQKVRRITRTPSLQMLSEAQLDEYINTFMIYDMAQRLKLFNLRRTLTFHTTPFVDTYGTNTTDPNNPLFNFKNIYTVVHPGIYVGGYLSRYTQKRDEFFGYFPPLKAQPNSNVTTSTLIGMGPYSGTIGGRPILQKSFVISALDASGNAMTYVDAPIDPQTGNIVANANLPISGSNPVVGSLNYQSGNWSITFQTNPAPNQQIQLEYQYYTPGRPWAVLFFNDEFILRPVPNRVYSVTMQVDVRPTELLAADAIPEIAQWWQYIAWGAARKVFEDKFDFQSLEKMQPMFEEQEMLVQTSTIETAINERTSTIYTTGNGVGPNWFFNQTWQY